MGEREHAEASAKNQCELEEARKQAEAEERQRQLEAQARIEREIQEQQEAEERHRVEELRRAAEEAEKQRLAQEARERRAQEAAEKAKKIKDFLAHHGYASVNTKRKTKFGRCKFPLHTAVKHDPEIVPLLLEAGADPSNVNSAGKTPHEYAKQVKSPAEALLQA